jgi:pilus assembly protein CpaE
MDALERISGLLPVIVIDPDHHVRSRLVQVAGGDEEMPSFATIADFQDRRPTGHGVVVVIGPSFTDPEGLSSVERLARSRPDVGVVLVAPVLTTEVLQQAWRTGVRDVVARDDPQEIRDAVLRVSASLDAPVPVPKEGRAQPLAKVITVFSTKGGAGKSVVATNLAVSLARTAAQRGDAPVVLVDADLQFGDAAVMLSLSPRLTIVDAVNSIDRLDGPMLESLLIHHPSGLRLLAAPVAPALAEQVTADHMVTILRLLRGLYSYVVVDTCPQFDEVALSVLDESDEIVLVTGMDVPNVKNVKLALQTMRLLKTPMEKIHLVLNRVSSKVGLEVREVEKMLELKADCLIPSDLAVPRSVNRGLPVIVDAPSSPVAKAFDGLASRFLPAPPDEPKSRRRGRG